MNQTTKKEYIDRKKRTRLEPQLKGETIGKESDSKGESLPC